MISPRRAAVHVSYYLSYSEHRKRVRFPKDTDRSRRTVFASQQRLPVPSASRRERPRITCQRPPSFGVCQQYRVLWMRSRRADRMAHPGRCDRPSWIGFGGKSKRRNFLATDGPDLREQVVVGGPLATADPGVDPCRNARAEIRAAAPIAACGSTPATGPLRYLKALSFWYSPSMPPQAGRFPAGGPGAPGAVGRRTAKLSALTLAPPPAPRGHVQSQGAPPIEPTRSIPPFRQLFLSHPN